MAIIIYGFMPDQNISITKVNDLVEEIVSASHEQSKRLEQVNSGLAQVDQVTQGNTAEAEESASAADENAPSHNRRAY